MLINKIYYSFILYGKLTLRNPFYIISFFMAFFYLGAVIYTYTSTSISNPANMLQLSSFLTQGLMLVFMFLGYSSMNVITTNPAKEVYNTLPRSTGIQVISNGLFLLFTNLLLCTLSTITILITYKISGFPFSILYTNSIFFIILYWYIPFLISSLFGAFLGTFLNNKMSVLFILLIWLLISPMNVYFIKDFLLLVGVNSFPTFLHLGVEDPRLPYNAFSGYIFTPESIKIKITWVILLGLSTAIFILFKKNRSIKNTLVILMSMFSILVFYSLQTNKILDSQKENMDELKYYDTYDDLENMDKNFKYKINKYDINLTINDQLNALVKVDLSSQIKGTRTFSLYHGFKVDSIKNENGDNFNFTQDGDFIQVHITQESKQLVFVYEGKSTVFMDANEHNLYLPNYFAWIPLNSANPSMKSINFSNHRLPNQPHRLTSYTLHYDGPKPLITNLVEENKNIYKGNELNGIYLINGELKTKSTENHKITYPISWENSILNSEKYISELDKSFVYINKLFKLEHKIPKKIMFIPASGPNDFLYSEVMWLNSDSLFILQDPYDFHPDNKFDQLIYRSSYQLIGSMLWKNKRIVYDDYNISIFFNLVTGKYINRQLNIEEPLSSDAIFYLDELVLYNDDLTKEQDLINDVISFMNNNSKKDTEQFLYNWSKILNNPEVSWEDLDKLLRETKKGGNS